MRSTRSVAAALARCAVAFGALASARAAAGDAGAALQYAVRYGPLQVLELRTTTRFDGERYHASSDLRTVGIVAALFPWSSSSDSSGVRSDGAMRPQRYHSSGEYRGRARVAQLDYDSGGSIRAQVEPPPEQDDRDPVPAALQEGTIDPLSATMSAVLSGCRGQLRVFDGRRRYDLSLTDLGDTDTPSSRYTLYSGRSRHCRAAIEPLAGFWRSEPRHDERPTQIDFWVAPPKPGLLAVPVYLEITAPRGTLAVHLASAEALPNGPANQP
jgi:hypothetical protein